MTSKNTFKVTKTQLLTHDIMLLEIKSSLPFQYQAGDYLMLGFNEGEKNLIRLPPRQEVMA